MKREICKYDACTGCMACYNVCTHDAISFEADNEGFLRPSIIEDKCVDCNLCTNTCPINNLPKFFKVSKVFSGWSNNEEIRMSSSSGGAFTEISRIIIEQGGIVFGCSLNDELKAEHIYVDSIEDLKKKLSGSKYTQSIIGNSYRQARLFLNQGRKVLFSGTPCQIAGLRSYLKKEYENLITVDLICHGVPSPLIFEEYKKYIEKREKMQITDIKFRCKKSSWIFYNMTIKGHVEKNSDLKIYNGNYYEDPYIRGFLRDYFLRPSCHECKFTLSERCSDFTIADWWGYRKEKQEDKDFAYKGVSLLLVNTEKAVSMVSSINMSLRERTIEDAKKTNKSLCTSYTKNDKRDLFWEDYRRIPFEQIVKKYMKPEKIQWSVNIRQKYKNTDLLLTIIRLLSLPQRILNKIRNSFFGAN